MTTRTQVKSLAGDRHMRDVATALLHATRGCRPDMHDAALGLEAVVSGRWFDNAGTPTEMAVSFARVGGGYVAQVNLATLVALARVGAARLLEEAGHGAP